MVRPTKDDERLKQQQSAILREQQERDYVASSLLADPRGRAYIWWLLTITNVNVNPFSNNALTTAFSCGEMNVGQRILAHILEVNPAGYVQMLKEKLNGPGNTSPGNTDSPDDDGNSE